ncbi:hypothetical protein [Paenibacillus sp. FSL L8-0506]|uniref:hypothetical protein n=1 Tax=Paenibacillus sp. FSL L8-0506 TaxID=2975335 RepID=UPI0030FCC1C5
MRFDEVKVEGLFKRVYNNKLEEHDGNDIKEFIKMVFQSGVTPDPTSLHKFNNLVVKTADEVFKVNASKLIELIANFKNEKQGTIVKYDVPQNLKVKRIWSANGSGVDLQRVEKRKSYVATGKTFSTGIYYEPLTGDNAIEDFRVAVNKIADAKTDLYFGEITKLIQAAVTQGTIPAKNVVQGSNTTLLDYNKLASALSRFGGKPIFIGDTSLIDYFAMQQATDGTIKGLLYDEIKKELLTSLNPTTIGRSTAVNLINPFTNTSNTKTKYPVNVGYMLAGEAGKPFYVTEFGGMRQFTEQDPEDERIKLKIVQEADISLFHAQTVGYIKEDAAVSL